MRSRPAPSAYRSLVVALLALLTLAGTACGADVADALADPAPATTAPPTTPADGSPASGRTDGSGPSETAATAAPDPVTAAEPAETAATPGSDTLAAAARPGEVPGTRIADLVRPGPSALRAPPVDDVTPRPVGLSIDGIDVVGAPVRDVGVEPDGEFEVPDADEVGWYRFGPSPGETGSAVLAAHIAFDGRDGVFRHLDDVQPGARIAVELDDGSRREFVAVELAQYAKDQLPFDDVFRRVGEPTLVLITCGGDFNPGTRSYDDNVVVYAEPVAA